MINNSDEFNIEHRWIKVKVTVGLQNISPFTKIQTVRSYNSTLVQARKLILSMHVHRILIDRASLPKKSERKDEKTFFWLPPIIACLITKSTGNKTAQK